MNQRQSGRILLVVLVALTALVLFWPRATPRTEPQSSLQALGGGGVTAGTQSGAPQPGTSEPAMMSDGNPARTPSAAPHPTAVTVPVATAQNPALTPPPTPRPTSPHTNSGGIVGTATWYDAVPGQAAAGPKLRAYLGSHWRGTIVRVCAAPGNCVVAMLSDWCLCSKGDRIIDLDDQLFAALAPLDQGTLTVEVEAVR